MFTSHFRVPLTGSELWHIALHSKYCLFVMLAALHSHITLKEWKVCHFFFRHYWAREKGKFSTTSRQEFRKHTHIHSSGTYFTALGLADRVHIQVASYQLVHLISYIACLGFILMFFLSRCQFIMLCFSGILVCCKVDARVQQCVSRSLAVLNGVDNKSTVVVWCMVKAVGFRMRVWVQGLYDAAAFR